MKRYFLPFGPMNRWEFIRTHLIFLGVTFLLSIMVRFTNERDATLSSALSVAGFLPMIVSFIMIRFQRVNDIGSKWVAIFYKIALISFAGMLLTMAFGSWEIVIYIMVACAAMNTILNLIFLLRPGLSNHEAKADDADLTDVFS